MDLEDIKSLIDAAKRLDLAELQVRKHGVTLRLVREGALAGEVPENRSDFVAVPSKPMPARADLVAQLSGVLHLSPSPEAPAFVALGQAVKAGDTLCIIEAMKVFNSVSAERDGTIEAVLFETGAEIEFGQIVMRIT